MATAPDLAGHFAQALAPVEKLETVWIGFSGGVDSTALLLAGQTWVKNHGVRLAALHANHNLQALSAEWQTHCRKVCDHLRVELIEKSLEVPAQGNMEALARLARYDFFAQHLGSQDVLVLAHHMADQSETALLRLFQGRGLAAMQTLSTVSGMTVVRPFLRVHKARLIEYVQAAAVPWIEDPSNQDQSLDRNFLRATVMPPLYQRWPNLDPALHRVVGNEQATRRALSLLIAAKGGESGERISFTADLLLSDRPAGVILLRTLCANAGYYEITDKSLHEFLAQCEQGNAARLDVNAASLVCKKGLVFLI